MTATKVIGFYMESGSDHRTFFRMVKNPVCKTRQFLMRYYWRYQASRKNLECSGASSQSEIDVKVEVQSALQSPPQGGCRELATVLACAQILCKLLNEPNTSKETVKNAEDRMKLFLLHTVLLNKLPLKYRAQAINSSLLDQFCNAKDGKVYPFDEIHTSLWEILKSIHDSSADNLLDMSSVADIMDGRLVHTLFFFVLEQRSMGGFEGLNLPEDVIKETEATWGKVVAAVNSSHQSDSLESQFFPFFVDNVTSVQGLDEGTSKPDSCLKPMRLLDVENVLVNEYAGDIRSKINAMAGDENEDEVFNIGREFDEIYHWHSLKPLSDDHDRTKKDSDKPPDDPSKRFWFFKRKQQLNRWHRSYGNSLVGGNDRAKIITVTETGAKKKKGKNKEGKMSKKAAQIIEENEQKRKEQEKAKYQEKWHHVLKDIENNLKKR
ncbi:putative ATP-dependent RNA helicase ddx60 [Desmophyllum pertusum]|uniref:ATP-dependent RNA helicase ddx60 n=1 Tax=Desmophyllum pertusum TaxID=174260 RepID=A0A9X0D5Z7_9CNID|nr:putative ATP-dependent RNA helicase ddx60 [Desmophyllum pertusum]